MVWYFDSSALVKLAANEPESEVLKDAVRARGWILTSSALAITEVLRTMNRKGPAELVEARGVLSRIDLSPLTERVLNLAAELEPSAMRALDAIHVASALTLGEECEGVVTYDHRMRDAAQAAGFTVEAPGQSP